MSALSDLLNANRHGWKARRTAEEAEKLGIDLKRGTLSGYFAGKHGTPSESLLADLSTVLDIPLGQLREAAGRRADDDPYYPPRESHKLTDRQRLALDELIRATVAEPPSRAPSHTEFLKELEERLQMASNSELSDFIAILEGAREDNSRSDGHRGRQRK